MVDEMETIQREYAPQCLFFMDDVFLCGARCRRRAHDIAAEIKPQKLRVNFAFSCRVSDIDKDTLVPLRDAGLYHLSFGVKTIDVGSLKLFNKRIRLETFERAFTTLSEFERFVFDEKRAVARNTKPDRASTLSGSRSAAAST